MRAALLLLLDYEKIENDSNSDESDIEDETKESPQVILSKETIYKVRLIDSISAFFFILFV